MIVASAEVARLFVNSLKNKKLYTEATGVIVYGEALALLNDAGIIAVVEKGLENMSSSNDYQIKPILNLLNYLNDQGVSDKSALIQQLSAYFLNKKTHSLFSIVNINTTRSIIGTVVDGKINITSSFVYPGGKTVLENFSKTQIYFSYAGGQTEQAPLNPTFYNPLQMEGAVYAVHVSNNDLSLLPNFNFSLTFTDCGEVTSNYSYISSCLNKYENLGSCFLSTAWAPSTDPYIQYFSPKPVVSINTAFQFSNNTLYPNFIRVIKNYSYSAVSIINFLRANN